MTCTWAHQYWAGSNRVNLRSRMLVVMQRQSGFILSSYDGIIAINGWYQSIAWLQYCYHTMTCTCLCSSARVNTNIICVFIIWSCHNMMTSEGLVIRWWHTYFTLQNTEFMLSSYDDIWGTMSSIGDIHLVHRQKKKQSCHHMMTVLRPCHPMIAIEEALFTINCMMAILLPGDSKKTMSSIDDKLLLVCFDRTKGEPSEREPIVFLTWTVLIMA